MFFTEAGQSPLIVKNTPRERESDGFS